jgi:tetratricopeptide (TPR) repeat protein
MATALVKMGQAYRRIGNPEEASSAFQKALDTANLAVALQRDDVYVFYPIGEAQAGMAEGANALAHKSRNQEERSRLVNEARAAYESSLETWRRIPNPSSISSSLFLSNGPPHQPAGMLPAAPASQAPASRDGSSDRAPLHFSFEYNF